MPPTDRPTDSGPRLIVTGEQLADLLFHLAAVKRELNADTALADGERSYLVGLGTGLQTAATLLLGQRKGQAFEYASLHASVAVVPGQPVEAHRSVMLAALAAAEL